MPWRPKDLMDTKREFVELALQEGPTGANCAGASGLARKPPTPCWPGMQPRVRPV